MYLYLWETGLSCPDISLLSSLAGILGVTTGELLNGERSGSASPEVEASVGNALQYAGEAVKSKAKSLQGVCAAAFSLLLLAGVVACAICDLAISGGFTWSLFPISSAVFAWLVFFPVVKFGGKAVWVSLAAASVLTIPFLFVLDRLVETGGLLMPIGVQMTLIAAVFLWCVFALFKLLRTRRLAAAAVSLLLAIPAAFFLNLSLSALISEPLIDVWDIVTFSILAAAAVTCFFLDFSARKRKGR